MAKESTADRTGRVAPDNVVKDPKHAFPAHPLPAANGAPDAESAKVKTDAEVEDRFEATDN